jgi:hypothetical protein
MLNIPIAGGHFFNSLIERNLCIKFVIEYMKHYTSKKLQNVDIWSKFDCKKMCLLRVDHVILLRHPVEVTGQPGEYARAVGHRLYCVSQQSESVPSDVKELLVS